MSLITRQVSGAPLTYEQGDSMFAEALRDNPARLKMISEFLRAAAKISSSPIIRSATPVSNTKPTKLGQIVVVKDTGAFISYGYTNTSWSAL